MMDFPSTVWRVVVLSQIFFTVPVVPWRVMISPILKGLDPIIEKELKKSSISLWEAKATAIPPTPSEAKSGVKATPILSKKIKAAKIQSKTWKIVLRISVRFFFVLVSWWGKPFSITTFSTNLSKAPTSRTKARTKRAEKKIRKALVKGKAKEAKKAEKAPRENQEIQDIIWRKSRLKGCLVCNFGSKKRLKSFRKVKLRKTPSKIVPAPRKVCTS